MNKYGCTPKKSLTLEFPSTEIFIESENYTKLDLILHFIRGYFDGDGCISYLCKDHTSMLISLLGTESFLNNVQHYITNYKYKLGYNNKKKSDITRVLQISGENGLEVLKKLYSSASIYLERKYERFMEYCRLYEKSYRLLQTNIGEGCDANTEISTEIKESVPS